MPLPAQIQNLNTNINITVFDIAPFSTSRYILNLNFKGKMQFAPKEKIELDPPLSTPYTVEQLAVFDGMPRYYHDLNITFANILLLGVQNPRIFVAIKGTIFDVTRNAASYGPGKGYSVFVAKDASRALAKSSLKPEDAVPYYQDLSPKELKVLEDWYTYFSFRYNVVGRLV